MKPLTGFEVLDFTREVSGPHCTQLLAGLGADVIKIEPPGGERPRSEWVDAFSSFNLGGKRSVSIDLKTDEGKRIAQQLAERVDIVVENFRPGVLERFGLDYDAVAKQNADVIYCSISGFGQDGPYRDFPAYDPIAQALSGVLASTGYPDRPPVRIGASFIDCGTAVHAALFVMAAALEREQTGEGRYIDTSLFDTAVSWMAYRIAEYSRTGRVRERTGSGNDVTDRVYYAGDDKPFYVKAITQQQYESMCHVIDRDDLIEDERFETDATRIENTDALEAELKQSFAQFDREQLVERLAQASVPIGSVQDVGELVDQDPHVKARGMLTDSYNLAAEESLLTSTLPFRTDKGSPELGGRPPELGEHTFAVLSELGYSDEKIHDLIETGVLDKKDE
ncbi:MULTISPECIES: CaiB/BaiF CoA-transferase family protein [unclassified Haladaptatus]|uniref:CaiB/BaiF CoA transferase family protein n=1 Tax=unclassified Haladaptatus TaxID=2622732 RepID=UPI0023E8F3C4|nr:MULTISPECIES: CaiB/BaiF CoA-transferase family protein [unclassified Haladaptatus]